MQQNRGILMHTKGEKLEGCKSNKDVQLHATYMYRQYIYKLIL